MLDLGNPDTYLDGPPHERFSELRACDPLHWQQSDEGGFWAVLRHADVEHVARNPQLFSSAVGGVVLEDLDPPALAQMRGMLLAMDPPGHGAIRRPVAARLGRHHVAELEDDIRTICQDVFARTDSRVDFVKDLAARLPTQVIGTVMGLPSDDWQMIHALAERMTRGQDPLCVDDPDGAGQASLSMGLYAYEFAVARLSLDAARDDLTSVLLARHSPAEFAALFVQLVAAGQDTTATLLSSGLLTLLQHPEQLAAVRTDLSLLPSAVEEMLRYANPLHYFRRTATVDTELQGKTIRSGDKVAMFYTSANRDEEVFERSQLFDVRRSPNRHLSFGFGEHFCLGAHLARLEARVFFEELLVTYSSINLDGEPVRLRSNLNNALRTLPIFVRR